MRCFTDKEVAERTARSLSLSTFRSGVVVFPTRRFLPGVCFVFVFFFFFFFAAGVVVLVLVVSSSPLLGDRRGFEVRMRALGFRFVRSVHPPDWTVSWAVCV